MPKKKKGVKGYRRKSPPGAHPPAVAHQEVVLVADALAELYIGDPEQLAEFRRKLISQVNSLVRKRTAAGYARWVKQDDEEGLREVPVERRARKRRPPRHVQVPERLSAALSLINGWVRLPLVPGHPETALHARLRETCEKTHPAARQQFVEHILRTPPEGREKLLIPTGEPAPNGWGIVAEGAALCLVVEEIAKNGVTPWVKQVLDCLRGPRKALVPPPPPLQARPGWHPPAHEAIQVVAAILANAPDSLLGRLRGCRYRPCWTNPHECSNGLSPYFIDRSPFATGVACCPTHKAKK